MQAGKAIKQVLICKKNLKVQRSNLSNLNSDNPSPDKLIPLTTSFKFTQLNQEDQFPTLILNLLSEKDLWAVYWVEKKTKNKQAFISKLLEVITEIQSQKLLLQIRLFPNQTAKKEQISFSTGKSQTDQLPNFQAICMLPVWD